GAGRDRDGLAVWIEGADDDGAVGHDLDLARLFVRRQAPDAEDAVLRSAGDHELAVGRDGHTANAAGIALEVPQFLATVDVPHADGAIGAGDALACPGTATRRDQLLAVRRY